MRHCFATHLRQVGHDIRTVQELLGLHDGDRAWKSFDWDAMGRLHAKGLISDPVGKAKSVALSQSGLNQAQALLQSLFGTAK